MNLTRTEKITLLSTFGVAIFTILVHLGIRFYFQADLRYELGSYYLLDKNAITYIKLTNYGKSDAEEVALNVEFPTIITDFSADNPLTKITISSGGKSSNNFIGKISSIHPAESVTIYFSLKHDKNIEVSRRFLKQSTYKNGITKTGKPIGLSFVIAMLIYILTFVIFYLYINRQIDRHYEIIDKILKYAKEAKDNNSTNEEYKATINNIISKTKFRKKGLELIANSAYSAHFDEGNS